MNQLENEKYERAKKKMEDIKGFYSHLVVYLIVNSLLILLQLGLFTRGIEGVSIPEWSVFSTPFFWGIGLFFHGLYVFQDKFRFFKDWEERKIKEYMEKDESEFKETDKWR